MTPFHIELYKNEYISNYIRECGCWEPITTEVINELFRAKQSDTVFIDIGANIGYFSLLAAQQGVPVVAFEPIASNYRLLTNSIAINEYQNLIRTFMVPLSNKEEQITLNVSKNNMGLCSTRKLLDVDFSYSQTSTAKTLDNYFGYKTQNHLIVKIDVEEQEKNVLQGMEKTLASGKVTHIILEIVEYDSEIFDLLRKYGFNYCVIIGYSDYVKTHVDQITNYLTTPKYLSTLDNTEKIMMRDTNQNKQKMLLLYTTPQPV